jgi:nitroimidazol reductase NimA-like FMN-containing flavoprotein (pyridoxamine 5'-phosphate oxidase superfamily)
MDAIPNTSRTTVRRIPKNASYDRSAINAILDEALVCHVGFVEGGLPYVIPTLHARAGDRLFIHGSAASRLTRTLATGHDVCVSVTLLDGIVFARSVFNHSMNYRSVIIFGKATAIEGEEEKREAMRLFSEHAMPGRWREARQPTAVELKATLVLALPIEEASAKVRTGPPVDDEDDLTFSVWAGVLPLALCKGEPVTDTADIDLPGYLRGDGRWSR